MFKRGVEYVVKKKVSNSRQMMLIDEETDFLARYLLTMLSQKGEDYLLDYMKRILLKHKNRDYHVIDGSLVLD